MASNTDLLSEVNGSIEEALASFYADKPLTMLVRIIGASPLLMNNPAAMSATAPSGSVSRRERVVLTPEEEAEGLAYRNATGELVVPSRCIMRSFLEAAKGFKDPQRPRAGLTRAFAAGVRATGIEFVLVDPDSGEPITQATPYGARVTYGSGRSAASIIKHRPMIESWAVNVSLTLDPSLIQPGQVAMVAATAGRSIGLLDWRPEKNGSFGTFQVESAEAIV